MGKLGRYALASIGPVGSAAAQFALSLALLRTLSPVQFGGFAFLLVAASFSWGLWSALFCAPLPILLNEGDAPARALVLKTLFSTNLLVALLAGAVFWGIAAALAVPPTAGTLFAGYAAIALLRWFARAHAYATDAPLRTTASDLAYSMVLLAGVGLVLLRPAQSFDLACGALLVSAAAGLLPFGRRYLRAQFGGFRASAVAAYAPIWRRFSGWSLLGVLTTEATANSHAYLVTAWFGPTAFAPIAASGLTVRPMSVAMNALTEFERAQMARQVAERRIEDAMGSVRHFRLALIAAWAGTVGLVLALFATYPRLIFPAEYDLRFLQIAATLWMLVAAVRMLRTPESALLQAAGAFRPLAMASVISSGASIAAVLILLVVAGTLWSIAGVLVGEGIYAAWIWRQTRRWRAAQGCRADAVVPA